MPKTWIIKAVCKWS